MSRWMGDISGQALISHSDIKNELTGRTLNNHVKN